MSDKWDELGKRLAQPFGMEQVCAREVLELLDERGRLDRELTAGHTLNEALARQTARQQRAIETLLEGIDCPLGYQRQRWKYHAERILKGEEP